MRAVVIAGLMAVGVLTGCGGAEMAEGQDLAGPAAQNLTRCQGGCEARYGFCIDRALQPPEVCADTRADCYEQCELNGL